MSEGANNRIDYGYDNISNITSLIFTAGATSVTQGYSYDSLKQLTALARLDIMLGTIFIEKKFCSWNLLIGA
jgi:hypothetical protein